MVMAVSSFKVTWKDKWFDSTCLSWNDTSKCPVLAGQPLGCLIIKGQKKDKVQRRERGKCGPIVSSKMVHVLPPKHHLLSILDFLLTDATDLKMPFGSK